MQIIVKSIQDMKWLADKLIPYLENGTVYTLNGDLGAGKTTLVSLIAQRLNVEETPTSPTFSLVNIYNGDMIINHLDLYRLETPEEIESFEYEEYFYPENSITFIEWPKRAQAYLPRDTVKITIKLAEDGTRLVDIDGIDFE